MAEAEEMALDSNRDSSSIKIGWKEYSMRMAVRSTQGRQVPIAVRLVDLVEGR